MPITSFMLSLHPWLAEGEEINEEGFLWEEKEFDNSFLVPSQVGGTRLPNDCLFLGWCEGYKLRVLPKIKTIAVLFEKDCRRFWMHLPTLD